MANCNTIFSHILKLLSRPEFETLTVTEGKVGDALMGRTINFPKGNALEISILMLAKQNA